MADATPLTPPSRGLSATLFQKGCESYIHKGPENVNITLTKSIYGETV